MPNYSPAARERAMKLQDVLLQAMAGKMSWIEAADVLGLSARMKHRGHPEGWPPGANKCLALGLLHIT